MVPTGIKAIPLSMCGLLFFTDISFSSDMNNIKTALANHICPRPAATYDLIAFKDVCADPDRPDLTFNESAEIGRCQDHVTANNAIIVKYNEFIRQNCMGNSQGAGSYASKSVTRNGAGTTHSKNDKNQKQNDEFATGPSFGDQVQDIPAGQKPGAGVSRQQCALMMDTSIVSCKRDYNPAGLSQAAVPVFRTQWNNACDAMRNDAANVCTNGVIGNSAEKHTAEVVQSMNEYRQKMSNEHDAMINGIKRQSQFRSSPAPAASASISCPGFALARRMASESGGHRTASMSGDNFSFAFDTETYFTIPCDAAASYKNDTTILVVCPDRRECISANDGKGNRRAVELWRYPN